RRTSPAHLGARNQPGGDRPGVGAERPPTRLGCGTGGQPVTPALMTQHAVPPHVAHLDRWVLAGTAVFMAAGVLRAGFARLAYGPRRPWLPFAVRLRLRMRPGPGWAGRWQLWRAHG